MKKKLLILGLSLPLVLGVASCGNKTESATSEISNSEITSAENYDKAYFVVGYDYLELTLSNAAETTSEDYSVVDNGESDSVNTIVTDFYQLSSADEAFVKKDENRLVRISSQLYGDSFKNPSLKPSADESFYPAGTVLQYEYLYDYQIKTERLSSEKYADFICIESCTVVKKATVVKKSITEAADLPNIIISSAEEEMYKDYCNNGNWMEFEHFTGEYYYESYCGDVPMAIYSFNPEN